MSCSSMCETKKGHFDAATVTYAVVYLQMYAPSQNTGKPTGRMRSELFSHGPRVMENVMRVRADFSQVHRLRERP